MDNFTVESTTSFEMGNYTKTNISTNFTNETNITMLISTILTPSGGGSGTGGKGPQCFYWDLFVRILLNSILAMLGIFGNR